MGGGRADPQPPAVRDVDPGELVDRLDVDEVREVGQAELRDQQQLGAAAVGQRVGAELVEEVGRLLDASRAGAGETA